MRDESNTRATCRFNALMTPIRANIVGPPLSAMRIRASIAAMGYALGHSVDLQPERLDDRRPEGNVGGEGLPEFVGV